MDKLENILPLIEKLKVKYANAGQDLEHYLQGLLEANFEPYWEYINLESLLALQQPKTDYPDEIIFISYHQVNEIFFKLILHEIKQICFHTHLDAQFFTQRLQRINRYFETLIDSFDIMIEGMERQQFLKFRMALLPASGFQSAQYRFIELALTDVDNLVHDKNKAKAQKLPLDEKIELLYWKSGAINIDTSEKTLTLKQFEQHYNERFLRFVHNYKSVNILQQFHLLKSQNMESELLVNEMKRLDTNINVNWPLAHFKSAVKYLKVDNESIAATGGTNWTSYLPPKFQRIISFPEIWTTQEREDWGKKWVEHHVPASRKP